VEGVATNVRPESSSKWARLDDVVSRFSVHRAHRLHFPQCSSAADYPCFGFFHGQVTG